MDDMPIKNSSAEDREAWHEQAEQNIKTFSFERPDMSGPRPKQIAMLVRGDLASASIQVVKEGGENNLHYHTGRDGLWFVLRGRARFYGKDDVLLGEFGEKEGILLPAGSRYWFEKVGDEELEIIQFTAQEEARAKTSRVNIDAHKDWMNDTKELQVYAK